MDYDSAIGTLNNYSRAEKEAFVGAPVTLASEDYQRLLQSAHLLQCLEDMGVDGWEWYEYAVTMHKRELPQCLEDMK